MVWHQRGLFIGLVADDKGQVELGLHQGSGTRELELEAPKCWERQECTEGTPHPIAGKSTKTADLLMLCSPASGIDKVLN